MKHKGCVFAIVAFLLFTACDSGDNNQATNRDAVAIDLYKQSCQSCHAADLSGQVGPGLQEIGSKLTEEQLYEIIHDGTKGMPSYQNRFDQEEIEALAQWLAKKK